MRIGRQLREKVTDAIFFIKMYQYNVLWLQIFLEIHFFNIVTVHVRCPKGGSGRKTKENHLSTSGN